MNIEKLEKQFTGTGEVKDFTFSQVLESENCYVYEVKQGEDCDNAHYEVFNKIISPKCIDFAKKIYSETEFKESYPKANHFGLVAWTYRDYNKAKSKLNELEAQIRNKVKQLN